MHDNVTGLTWIIDIRERKLSDLNGTDEDLCSVEYESLEPSKTALSDFGTMVSGTLQENESNHSNFYLWAVDTVYGDLKKDYSFDVSELVQRCVLDESLNYEKTPYLDDNGLLWSEISPDWELVYTGKYYCDNLSKTDPEHWWRLPTVDELFTLVRNDCGGEEYDACPVDVNGKYSVFGDVTTLLSGEYYGDESYYAVDFLSVVLTGGKDSMERIRCVSSDPSPCAGDPCAAVENSTGTCIPLSQEEYECECEDEYSWIDDACLQVAEAG